MLMGNCQWGITLMGGHILVPQSLVIVGYLLLMILGMFWECIGQLMVQNYAHIFNVDDVSRKNVQNFLQTPSEQ